MNCHGTLREPIITKGAEKILAGSYWKKVHHNGRSRACAGKRLSVKRVLTQLWIDLEACKRLAGQRRPNESSQNVEPTHLKAHHYFMYPMKVSIKMLLSI
jgi:hypothetical protein